VLFGALRCTALMPPSRAAADEYLSLVPSTSPLPPFSTKYGWPAIEVRRW
jgi:hypothetical protein